MSSLHRLIPWCLGWLRAALFLGIALTGMWFYDTPLSSWQVTAPACMMILLSDILDGVLARRYFDHAEQIKFRYFDSLVDKIGMIAALVGFWGSGQLLNGLFFLFFVREIASLTAGIGAYVLGYRELIRGDGAGRAYYCLLCLFVLLQFPKNLPFALPEALQGLFGVVCAALMFVNFYFHMKNMKVQPWRENREKIFHA